MNPVGTDSKVIPPSCTVVLAEGMETGTDPAVIAKVIVAAATDPKPKLRYPAGSGAGRVSMLRRLVPARIFDMQIRKINRMA